MQLWRTHHVLVLLHGRVGGMGDGVAGRGRVVMRDARLERSGGGFGSFGDLLYHARVKRGESEWR